MRLEVLVFEGVLFDGKSSNSKPVSVVLYPDRLVIQHISQEGIKSNQTWETNKLKDFQKISKDLVQIRFGDFPSQTLEVKSLQFVESFRSPSSGFEKLTHQVVHGGWGALLSLSVFVIGLLAASYFFVLPWLAEQSVALVPKEYEVQMGEGLYKSMVEKESIDHERTEIANQFLKQIDFETDYPLQVTIVKSDIKNAFALPGGHIVVYTELLDNMKSYKELAGLLGHEVGHVKHRHTTKHIFRSFSGYLLISMFLGDFSGITASLLDNANQINQLSYSRNLETEADLSGFETLGHNHIDPNGMLLLFENLQAGNEKGSIVPEFLSTHPITENRIELIQEKISQMPTTHVDHAFLEGLFNQLQERK